MDVKIRVSDRALESMVLSASESFVLGDGSKPTRRTKRKKRQVETYGYMWGFRRKASDSGTEHVYIDRFDESLSARRKSSSVRPNDDAVLLKNAIVERWSPQLSFLGDFHTHPYASRQKVEQHRGWEFSKNDIDAFKNDEQLWELANQRPLMLVMAVAPIERVHATEATWIQNNCWNFNIGQLRFWLAVGVGYTSGGKERKKLREMGNVYLDLDPRFYNETGDRLSGIV